MTGAALADPVAEARRVLTAATDAGVIIRVLGGVAVCLQAPSGRLRLPRPVRDIDVVSKRGDGKAASELLTSLGYVPNEMFNALHGDRRLLFGDPSHGRHLDVFVGRFAMCHDIPIAKRLDLHPLTVPLAELLLTKLQIVELTERDRRDIINLCFHHEATEGEGKGIEADRVAELCAQDWGLWRTCQLNLERSESGLEAYELAEDERSIIRERLEVLRSRIDAAPKTRRWRLRSRIGERMRWYAEPEEEGKG